MSEPYTPQSRLLAQILAQRHAPVLSAGQGIADALGDIGSAYYEKQALNKDEAKRKADASDAMKQMLLTLSQPRGMQGDSASMAGGMSPVPAQTAFPQGQTSMADKLAAISAGQPAQPSMPAQQADAPLGQAQSALYAAGQTAKTNPEVAMQTLPMALQLAQSMKPAAPRALPGMKPGDQLPMERADGTVSFTKVPGAAPVGGAIGEASQALAAGLITKDQYQAIVNKEGAGPKEPAVTTKFAFDRKLNQNRSVTPAEEASEPARYAPPIAAPQVKAYDKQGNEVGTFDVNDPALKAKLDAGEVTTQAPKQQTDQEKRSMGFANRMKNAEGDLNDLYTGKPAQGDQPATKGVNPAEGVGGWIQNTKIPFVQDAGSSIIPNSMQSDAYQKEKRAKMEWMTAMLRKDSGATIRDEEYTAIDKQYFPQNGDKDDVIAAKAKARQNAMQGIMLEATPGNQSAPAANQNYIWHPDTGLAKK